MLTSILQILAAVAGLISAFYWWRSARKPVEITDTLSDDMADGAFAFTVDDKHMVYDIPRQSKLSALGAKWAAASILAQAATMVMAAIPSPS